MTELADIRLTLHPACLIAATAVMLVSVSGCGSTRSQVARTTSTASTTSQQPGVALPTPVKAPPGVAGIATPSFPVDIVQAGDAMWVFPHHIQFAYRVDPTKNRVTAAANLGTASCTSAAAGGGMVWTSNCGSGENEPAWVYGIDPASNRVTIRVRGTNPVVGDGSLWVVDDSGKWVRRVDPRTGVQLARIATHSDQQPGGGTLVLGGVGYGSAWLDSDADKTVTRISTATNTVTAVIPLVGSKTQDEAFSHLSATGAGYINGAGMAFADGKAWLGNPAGLFEIDGRNNRVRLIRLPMRPFTEWGDIPVVAGAGSIWIRTADTRIDRVNPATGRVIAVYRAADDGGGGGLAVAFGSLWVDNAGADSVWREPIKPR